MDNLRSMTDRIKRYYFQAAKKSLQYNEAHIPWMVWAALALVVAAIFDYLVGEPSAETIYVRIGMALTALPMAFRASSKFRNSKFWVGYWIFACTAIFPFGFGLMLTLNAASTPVTESLNQFWLIQYLVALFLFIQLVCFVRLSLPLWTIASAACCASVLLVAQPNIEELQRVLLYPLSAYLTVIIVGSLFNRNSDIVTIEKSETASNVSLNVAHELRTPLAGIRRFADGIQSNFGKIVDGYQLAVASNLVAEPITERKLAQIHDALLSISEEVTYSNTIIDMLLVSTAEQGPTLERGGLSSATQCCETAIARFPFNNDIERGMVRLEAKSDFNIETNELLIIHMLFNLIKNAIPHALKSSEQAIVIRVSTENGARRITVKNSGSALDEETREKIFDRFYTTQPLGQGSGIGLSFCKRTMSSIGGTVVCESDGTSYCEFILEF